MVLQDTGISRDQKSLILAWPHRSAPFIGLKIERKRGDFWVKTLAESERLALFVYITPECIETSTQKCHVENLTSLTRKNLFLTCSKIEIRSYLSIGKTPAKFKGARAL